MESINKAYKTLQSLILDFFRTNFQEFKEQIDLNTNISSLEISKFDWMNLSRFLSVIYQVDFDFSSKLYLQTVSDVAETAYFAIEETYD